MKKKMKRFFTLKHYANDGFTLVELIVVIAILAILGGVAVPAYSGYVKKAELAADEALIAEVNMAFASAAALNGESHIGRTDVSSQILADGVLDYTGIFEPEFETFYEGGVFKRYTALTYEPANGTFTAGTAVGNGYVVSNADLEKILGSVWADMEPEELLNMIDGNATVVTALEQYEKLVESGVLQASAEELLGMSYNDFVAQELAKRASEYENIQDDWERSDKITEIEDEIKAETNKNLMVLLSAKDAQQAGSTIIQDLTNSGSGAKQMLINQLNGTTDSDKTLGLSQSALTFGLYTSYMESAGKSEEVNVLDMLSQLGDEKSGFHTYLNEGTQAEKDLEGLLSAMNVINSQNTGVMQDTVANGFGTDNTELQNAMAEILGQNK